MSTVCQTSSRIRDRAFRRDANVAWIGEVGRSKQKSGENVLEAGDPRHERWLWGIGTTWNMARTKGKMMIIGD